MQATRFPVVDNDGPVGELLLRVGTQDGQVVDEVLIDNEYSLPPRFCMSDTILDIGAHVGIFTLACLRRGAGQVIAVEPDPENVELLQANVGQRHGVTVLPKALWNPDKATVQFQQRPDYTAMGYVCAKGGLMVQVIGLDDLIETYRDIQLLKLDCEGAEWPALYTSNLLRCGYVQQIAAELHLGMRVAGFDCSVPALFRYMRRLGFEVLMLPGRDPKCNWLMHAWKE